MGGGARPRRDGQRPTPPARNGVRGVDRDSDGQRLTPLERRGVRGVDRVSPDGAVATIAGRQHGAVSWRQMRWAGLGSDAIAYRAENGRIHSVHRGVYLVGHVAAPPLGRDFAAVLACGEAALLSNESAAALWGFGPPSSLSHVLVVGRDPGRRAGIGVHRARRIDSADVRSRERVPVTSPARTLLDVAGGDGSGAGRLHAALGDDGRPRPTRSEAERMLLSARPSSRNPAGRHQHRGDPSDRGRVPLARRSPRGRGRRLRDARHSRGVRAGPAQGCPSDRRRLSCRGARAPMRERRKGRESRRNRGAENGNQRLGR